MRKSIRLAILTTIMVTGLSPTAYMAPVLQEPGQALENLPPKEQNEQQIEGLPSEAERQSGAQEFFVQELQLNSEANIDLTKYQKIAAEYNQQMVTLDVLNSLLDKLTMQLRQDGYLAATSYLPVQTSSNGIIRIEINFGVYGDIKIDNQSKLSDDKLAMLTRRLKTGQLIRAKELETVIYAINELGGVSAAGLLAPGQEIGSSDITLKVVDGKAEQGVFYVENYGSKTSGRYRYNLQTTFNNISGNGDKLKLNGLISNQNMHNYSVAYEGLVGGNGTTAGISYSKLDYDLGGIQAILGAQGNAETLSLYFHTPLYNTTRESLKLSYGYDYRKLKDELSTFNHVNERHANIFHVGINGHFQNNSSRTVYSLVNSYGQLSPDSNYASYGQTVLGSQGWYDKLALNVNHQQRINVVSGLRLKFNGQLSSKNLDSSEQLSLGGPLAVRAYPQGEASGDMGWQATMEYEYYPPSSKNLILSTYLDTGYVQERKDGLGADKHLSGWGIGITYSKPDACFIRLDYARKIGSEKNLSSDADKNGRLWLLGGTTF